MDDEELDLDGLLGGVGDGAGDAYAGLSPRSRRKRKNRDQMRAARQREKETMERLHAMVERLESQFRKLQQQKQNGASVSPAIKSEAGGLGGPTAPPSASAVITPAAYADALSTKAQYQEENFHLKQTLYEKNKLKETLERHVGDYVELTPEERHVLAEEFPQAGDTPVKPEPTSPPQGDDADGTNAYTPLSEGAVWAIIADVHRRMAMIKQSLLGGVPGNGAGTPQSRLTITVLSSSPSPSPAGANDTPVASDDEFAVPGGGYSTPQSTSSASPSPSPATPPASAPSSSGGYSMPPFLGWEVRHEVVNNHLRFYFEKSFGHISAFEAMVRMWDNERSMYSYRDVPLAGRQTMGVVQQLNDDTYVFQRRLADASTGHRELVSTYLRYRLRTNEGFLIGSVSIDDDVLAIETENPNERNVRDRAWAAKLYLWTEFVPIYNDSGCCVRMSGSVNLDTPAASQRNIANLVIGLLRWENLHIGPIFALADR